MSVVNYKVLCFSTTDGHGRKLDKRSKSLIDLISDFLVSLWG